MERPTASRVGKKVITKKLHDFLSGEYQSQTIYPEKCDIFNALHLTAYKDVRVVIIGQDPYHGPKQAHGLCFSVQPGIKTPPSLVNIYKELQTDLGCYIPNNGYLIKWAEQGVMMLNTVLTVREGQAHSHKKKGWETFTDHIIGLLNEHKDPIVFFALGEPCTKEIGFNYKWPPSHSNCTTPKSAFCISRILWFTAFFENQYHPQRTRI